MGMKEGLGDDPFSDDSGAESSTSSESDPDTAEGRTHTDADQSDSSADAAVQSRSLPYIHSRDNVKDGRQQRPIFLREQYEQGISELVDSVEDSLGEDVYQTDVLEAAIAVALDNPDTVAAKLHEWGYGWE